MEMDWERRRGGEERQGGRLGGAAERRDKITTKEPSTDTQDKVFSY